MTISFVGHTFCRSCEPHCVNNCDDLNGNIQSECGGCPDTAEWLCRPATWSIGTDNWRRRGISLVYTPVSCASRPQLPTEQRARAAIIGSWVADAATMGLHWIYNPNDIRQRLAAGQMPEFFEPPASPEYGAHSLHAAFYVSGANSPYADEVLPLLRSVANEGRFDAERFVNESVSFLEKYGGRSNSVMQQFVEAEHSGRHWPLSAVNDNQAHAIVKVPVLTARYAGSTELGTRVAEAVRVHQDSELAVTIGVMAARILERVILGASVAEALAWASEGGGAPIDEKVRRFVVQALCGTSGCAGSTEAAGDRLGRSCTLPGAFQVSLHAVSGCTGYVDAVRSNILAGGDQSSRAMLIGALLAAEQGDNAIPSEWKARVQPDRLAEVAELAVRVVLANEFTNKSVLRELRHM